MGQLKPQAAVLFNRPNEPKPADLDVLRGTSFPRVIKPLREDAIRGHRSFFRHRSRTAGLARAMKASGDSHEGFVARCVDWAWNRV